MNVGERPSDDAQRRVDELDALLGAFALDAVDGDERSRVEDYLRSSPRAALEVEQHREVAAMLAFTGADAPDGVWSRIAGAIEPSAPTPGPELARVLGIDRVGASVASASTHRRRVVGWWLGAAAAVILVVAGFVVAASLRTDRMGDPIAEAYRAAAHDRDSIRTELVAEGSSAAARGLIDQDGHGYLDATGLPTLDPALTYQLWGVITQDGAVVSLGILGPNPELETFTTESAVDALAVTIESAPGVVSDGNPDGAFVGTFD